MKLSPLPLGEGNAQGCANVAGGMDAVRDEGEG